MNNKEYNNASEISGVNMTEIEKNKQKEILTAHVGLFFACCDKDYDAIEQTYLKAYLEELNDGGYKDEILNAAKSDSNSLKAMFDSLIDEMKEYCSLLEEKEKEVFTAQMEIFIENLVNEDKNVDSMEVYYLNVWKENFVTREELKDIERYKEWYTEEGFWNTIKRACLKVSNGMLKNVFILYYAFNDDNVDTATKVWIGGVLGYFILPCDLIPDILPGGWLDDIALIALVIKKYTSNMHAGVISRAELKVSELKKCFG